jgi:hypothetical protein
MVFAILGGNVEYTITLLVLDLCLPSDLYALPHFGSGEFQRHFPECRPICFCGGP